MSQGMMMNVAPEASPSTSHSMTLGRRAANGGNEKSDGREEAEQPGEGDSFSLRYVTVATAIDALKRTTIGSGNGVGLRAGTFQTSFDTDGNQLAGHSQKVNTRSETTGASES